MCCLALTAGFLGPRIALFIWWVFGTEVDAAFDTWVWPLLGLIFVPWTTLAYVLVHAPLTGVSGLGWLRRGHRVRRRHRDVQRSGGEVAIPDGLLNQRCGPPPRSRPLRRGRAARHRRAGRTSPCSRRARRDPSKPASTSSASTPSETPPVRRVSSTTSTRPVAFASRRMSSTGSGASQRRSSTRAWMPSVASLRAARSDRWRPFAHVTIVRSEPSRYMRADPAGMCSVGSGAAHASSPSSCRSREWYSAIGSRKTHTVPSTSADSAQVTSIAAASSGREGDAITSPGMSRSTPTASSLWKWPPKPRW